MSHFGTNSERTRDYNRRVVLETVRLYGPISRAEIARRTALTAQSVSNIAAELRAAGLLKEDGRRRSGRGQPPVEMSVNPDGGFTVGLELQPHSLVGALVNLAGTVLAQMSLPVRASTPAGALPVLKQSVDDLLTRAEVDRRRIIGAGVVMPGPFGVEGLSSIGPTALPGWTGIDAAAVLGQALGLPVVVENDATAAAVGERLHGVARDLNNFAFLYFGTGLGLGLVLNGQPYKGALGNAGEIGHVVVEPDGRPCPCGNAGCLERYASLHAAQEYLGDRGVLVSDPSALRHLWDRGEPALLDWLAEAAARLRPVIQMLENIFDPECVVLGGALPDPLLDRLIELMQPLPRSVSRRPGRAVPRLLRGSTGRATPALGAAALPVFQTVTPDFAMVAREGAAAESA